MRGVLLGDDELGQIEEAVEQLCAPGTGRYNHMPGFEHAHGTAVTLRLDTHCSASTHAGLRNRSHPHPVFDRGAARLSRACEGIDGV